MDTLMNKIMKKQDLIKIKLENIPKGEFEII